MATNITEWYSKVRPFVPGCPNPTLKTGVLEAIRELCDYTLIWEKRLAPISSVVCERKTDIFFTSPRTIGSTTTDFTSYFAVGDIIVTNHLSNDSDYKSNTGPYQILTVAATSIVLATSEKVSTFTAGDEITISKIAYALTSSEGNIVNVDHAKYDGEVLEPTSESWVEQHMYQPRITLSTPERYYVEAPNRYVWLIEPPCESLENVLEVWANLKPTLTATTVEDFFWNDYGDCIMYGAAERLMKIPNMPWTSLEQSVFYRSQFELLRNKAWHHGSKGRARAQRGVSA